MQAFEVFLQYKTRIPVRGAILLNPAMDSVVLVKGWKKGANWSFPRGKINKDEDDLDCAVREVYEETGLDLRSAGLVPTTGKPKYIEINMREQQLRLYVFRDVPMDYNFQPQTRKEISKIQWYKLSELPTFRKKGAQNQDNAAASGANKFYMVAPFLVPLKKWVVSQKKNEEKLAASAHYHGLQGQMSLDDGQTEDDTWTGQPGAPQGSMPSIASLDGATRELQRLLKMQPPTQGLQPAITQEDKGSALLSILQANKPSAAAQEIQRHPIPHTPHDLTFANAPQPSNPHHHTNTHPTHINTRQPPPSFPIPGAQNQQYQEQQQQGYQQRQHPSAAVASQHQQQKSVTLVHPQPLPPQVQRAIFNNSAFQEHRHGHAQQPSEQSQPQFTQHVNAGLQGQQGQAPPQNQNQVPGQQGRPAQLTGQSMALLNAFKRDAAPQQQPAHQQDAPISIPSGGPSAQNLQPPPPYSQYPSTQSVQHTPAQNAVGPTAPRGAASDQHRSALLGMFKKAGAHSPVAQPQQSPASNLPQELSSSVPPQQRRNPEAAPLELSINNLSINQQHQPNHPQPAASQYGYQNQSQNQNQRPAQQQAVPSPPQQGTGAPAAPEQKRQLLSLFSKQQGRPAGVVHEMGNGGGNGPAENPRSRVASLASAGGDMGSGESSRRGSQTPISPADESFLLGYLQSVTNNASR